MPKTFQALQMNWHMQKVKRYLLLKAFAHRECVLKAATFTVLKNKYLRGQDRKAINN